MQKEAVAQGSHASDKFHSLSDTFDYRVSGPTSITATLRAREGPNLARLAALFDLAPGNVDGDARVVALSYDSADDVMAAEARSADGTRTAIVAIPGRQPVVLIVAAQIYSLTSLPIIGSDIAQGESIVVQGFTFNPNGDLPDAVARRATEAMRALDTSLPPFDPNAAVTGTMMFGTTPIQFSFSATGTPGSSGSAGGIVVSTTSDGTLWFTIQQTWGQTVMEKIGVQYVAANNVVSFAIDASISVDALTVELQGLGMTLSTQPTIVQAFQLQGGAATFSKSPLTISGGLLNVAGSGAPPDMEGEVVLGTGDFTAQIAGAYSDPSSGPSFFLYGDVESSSFPGPPSFSLSGIALGGGYNSALTVPTIDQVADFPFLKVLSDDTYLPGDPMGALAAMAQWVQPSPGAWWIAGGIAATSFKYINTSALLLVDDSSELVLALVGKSYASFPTGALQKALGTFAYAELDLLARLAPSEGVFSVQAEIASSSFLLSHDCVPTGGFAFFDWFGSNPNAGQFVLTLGGYNPGFVAPSYYPSVPRLGFDWSVDSSIDISGGAYFALTPSTLMLGGELEATYESGNLRAWFDAHADVLVQWVPFQYAADIGINIGASYTLDLLFCTTTVSVELGCDLEIWGPSTGGNVSVDWSIISFSIPFGEPQKENYGKPQWSDVADVLPDQLVGTSATAGVTPQASSYSAGSSIADDDGDPTQTWIVRPGKFQFNTSSSVPASSYTFGSNAAVALPSFAIAPLGSQNATVCHEVTISDPALTSAFTVEPVYQNMPSALWTSSNNVPLFTGLAVTANPAQVNNQGAPIPVANLDKSPLTSPSQPYTGPTPSVPAPADGLKTVSTIASASSGIASSTVNINRGQLAQAIQTALALNTPPANESMSAFAKAAGRGIFAAEPMLV